MDKILTKKWILTITGIVDAQKSACHPGNMNPMLAYWLYMDLTWQRISVFFMKAGLTIYIEKQEDHKRCPQHRTVMNKNELSIYILGMIVGKYLKFKSYKTAWNDHYLTPTTSLKSSSKDLLIYFWKLNLVPGFKWTCRNIYIIMHINCSITNLL